MIGIVIVSHAGLAIEILNAAELILGPLDKVSALRIDRDMSVDHARDELKAVIEEVGVDHDGVLILTDLFGGTPTNISAEFLEPGRLDILTGVNLPMLIKASSARAHHDLVDLVSMLKDYASDAVIRPLDLLNP